MRDSDATANTRRSATFALPKATENSLIISLDPLRNLKRDFG